MNTDKQTERKRAAEEASRMVTVVRDSNDAITIQDFEGRITAWNRGAELMFGYSEQEALKMKIWQLAPQNKAAEQKDFNRRLFAGEKVTSFETQRLTRDGRLLDVWLTVTKLVDDAGKVIGIAATGRDITDRLLAGNALSASETQYRRLFEAARDGILILNAETGMVTDVNPFLVELLGFPRESFLSRKVWELGFLKDVFASRTNFEELQQKGYIRYEDLPLEASDGRRVDVEFVSNVYLVNHHKVIQCNIRDVTNRKQSERRERLAREVLERLNYPESAAQAIHDIMQMIKKSTGIEAVGIRMREGEDFPYCETNGFPGHFVDAERHLCERDETGEILRDGKGKPTLECMCGNVIRGRTDPKLPFFTEGGSFWTNSTTDLLASTTEKDRQAHTRNRCNAEGYESVALIPLKSGGEFIGLLQFNDHRKNQFTPEMIHFFEGLGSGIGIALSRQRLEETLKESESRYRALFEDSIDGILITDLETKTFKYGNPAMCRMLGYTREELAVLGIADIHPKEDAQKVIAHFGGQTNGDITRTEDLSCIRKDGTILHVNVNGTMITINGKACAAGFFRDITEQKRADEEMYWKTALLEAQIDATVDGILIVDEKGNKVIQNQRCVELWKIPKDIADNHDDRQQIEFVKNRAKDPQKFVEKAMYLYAHPNETSHDEVEFKDGMVMDRYSAPVIGRDGTHFGRIWSFRDITERKQAEKKLHESEVRYRTLFESSRDAIMTLFPPDWKFTSANASTIRIFGAKDEQEFISMGPWDVSPERQPDGQLSVEKAKRMIETAMEKGAHFFEWTHRRIRGDPFPATVLLTRVEFFGQVGLQATVRDITELQRVEEALREGEKRYRALFQNAQDGMALADIKTGKLVDCNQALCRMVEREKAELVGQPQAILHPPRDVVDGQSPTFRKHRSEFAGEVLEDDLLSKSGKLIPMEIRAARINIQGRDHLLGIFRDLTVRKQAEEEHRNMQAQLIQAQKLDAMGSLAGGVAHEINNPINGITNYAQLIADKLTIEDPLREYAFEIIKETERVASIVRNLLQFARQEKQSRSPARLADIVNTVLSLVRTIIRHDQIAIEISVPEDLPMIKCRSQQIQQVVMNLLTNARDALDEKYPGHDKDKIILVTAHETVDHHWVRFTVEDHGIGVAPENRERVFDPFFTTKPKNKGTGLGLSISHKIVENHGGKLTMESEPGRWTRFHVDLPVYEEAAEEVRGQRSEVRGQRSEVRGQRSEVRA